MIKSSGLEKIKTAVFISGRGSNLNNLIKFSKTRKSPILIDLIVSNKKKALGLKYAKKYKIKKKILDNKTKKDSEKVLLTIFKKRKIKLICLAGFMQILSNSFIKRFKGKIINIHPSFLPKYKGLNTSVRALNNNEKFSGCTVHYVTSRLDSGKIILQRKVKIKKTDSVKTLSAKVLSQEHKLYPAAINKIFN